MTNGISISGIRCKKCGNYDHEMFGDNILVCIKCRNRIENPSKRIRPAQAEIRTAEDSEGAASWKTWFWWKTTRFPECWPYGTI